MELSTEYKDITNAIIAMFSETFAQSEGEGVGKTIGKLVSGMLNTVNPTDIHVFTALEKGEVLASILFTRMIYAQEDRQVFILSPLAVSTNCQGKGLGQRLIAHGLQTLRDEGVDIVLTYGDPMFYSKTGFAQITEAQAQPPQPLKYPHGWLGQCLTGQAWEPLKGPSKCVQPLMDPEHW